MSESTKSGAERRTHRRRPILATFSLFVVVPRKGVHRLGVHDASEEGLKFDLDTEGESHAEWEPQAGEQFEVQLYLNQSLFIPVQVEIKRIEIVDGVRQIGARFSDRNSKQYRAFLKFLQTLDDIVDVVHTNSPAQG